MKGSEYPLFNSVGDGQAEGPEPGRRFQQHPEFKLKKAASDREEFKGGASSDREFEAARYRGKSDGKASIEQVERPGAV